MVHYRPSSRSLSSFISTLGLWIQRVSLILGLKALGFVYLLGEVAISIIISCHHLLRVRKLIRVLVRVLPSWSSDIRHLTWLIRPMNCGTSFHVECHVSISNANHGRSGKLSLACRSHWRSKSLLTVIQLKALKVNIDLFNYFNTSIVLGLLLNDLVGRHFDQISVWRLSRLNGGPYRTSNSPTISSHTRLTIRWRGHQARSESLDLLLGLLWVLALTV